MSPDSRLFRLGPDGTLFRLSRIRLSWGTSPMLCPSAETVPMPKPIPVPVRQKLWERARAGETTASLARAFGVSPRAVRKLLRRLRERGPDALRPDYRRPERLPHAYPAQVREAAVALRREHPTWGATLIRVALKQRRAEVAWPAPRTL